MLFKLEEIFKTILIANKKNVSLIAAWEDAENQF